MHLRTKLFLSIGLLLLLLAGVLFIVPSIIIDRDIKTTTAKVASVLREEQKELQKNQTTLLQRQIEHYELNINSLLFLINDSEQIKEALSLTSDTENIKGWETAARLIGYEPIIWLVQISDLANKKTAVILSHNATPFPAKIKPLSDSLYWVLIETQGGKKPGDYLYVGIPVNTLSKKNATKVDIGDFLLIHWEDLLEYPFLSVEIQNELSQGLNRANQMFKEALEEKFQKKIDESPTALKERMNELVNKTFHHKELTSEVITAFGEEEPKWAQRVDLIQVLTPFFAKGVVLFGDKSRFIPAGIFRKKQDDDGIALLSYDIYRTFPLFDDMSYFAQHQPAQGMPQIAKGDTLIEDPISQSIYLGNTLKMADNLITIAIGVDFLAERLSLASDRMIVFTAAPDICGGLTSDGTKIPKVDFSPAFLQEISSKESGYVTFQGEKYDYFKIPLSKQWHLNFYVFTPHEKQAGLVRTLTNLAEGMKIRMSIQMLLICLGALVIALLILARLSRGITKPITQLASAAKEMGEGKFEEVVIPDVGHRKDEVAVLAYAFEEMVNGLREREHIRAVLDKVVSKDVADEILKTTLHLGGEDRVVTMLFSDIRGFTKLTQDFAPQDTINMLNVFMTKMSRIIEGEGGVIDKYIGDEIMALYGAPTTHPDHAIRAISSAMLMIQTLKKWNEDRQKDNRAAIELGIGIHTGVVVAGNMGAEDRLNYTVVGASVNLASRLCSVAAPMQIIISEDTLKEENIQESFYVQPLPPITLKGFHEPINIYQITGFKWI